MDIESCGLVRYEINCSLIVCYHIGIFIILRLAMNYKSRSIHGSLSFFFRGRVGTETDLAWEDGQLRPLLPG